MDLASPSPILSYPRLYLYRHVYLVRAVYDDVHAFDYRLL